MNRKVKFASFGMGKMGSLMLRCAIDNGGELVAAFARNPAQIGRDAGEVAGVGHLGITITDSASAEDILAVTHPDVCLIATRTLLSEIKDSVVACVKNGVNVLTTSEEALYPWLSVPNLAAELDELAKQNGCTITGGGNQDIYYGTMVSNMAGSSNHIDKITGISRYNVDDCGLVLAEFHGTGLSVAEFDQKFGICNGMPGDELSSLILAGQYVPSYMWYSNGWLASKFGLTLLSQTQSCSACTAEIDIYSSTLGRIIPAGDCLGMSSTVTTQTKEGVIIETEIIGRVYAPGEKDQNIWSVQGEPNTTLDQIDPQTAMITCASIVNRIPQVIDCAPGFVTTDKYPDNIYLLRPMNEYVTTK